MTEQERWLAEARKVNLALLMHSGISAQDAGFDSVVCLNDKGLAILAKRLEQACSEKVKRLRVEVARLKQELADASLAASVEAAERRRLQGST